MHGVKRSLVCFVAVASANPPFIQPSETSRETTESMNDGLIKDIRYACFLLNTPITQQNHPSAPCHVSYALQRQPQPCGRRRSSRAAPHPTHTRPAETLVGCRVIQKPRIYMVGPPLAESRPKFCCCRAVSIGGWSHVTRFFPGSAAGSGLKSTPTSNVILECGVDAFLFVKPRG
jgi:hypothetical protein